MNASQDALMTAALDYVNRGMALTWFEYGEKFPTHHEWNTPGQVVTTSEAARSKWGNGKLWNIGLVHGLSPVKTCSLDVDQADLTRALFAEFDIDLDALKPGVPCVQGNPANFRLEYRQPPGLDLPLVKLNWPDRNDPKKKITVFELRAGANQDVLPPSLHPSGHPYVWLTPLPANPADHPEPPPALLELWQNWSAWEKELQAACPWAIPVKVKTASRSKKTGANLNIIGQFNQAHSVAAILEAHGYELRGKTRYLPPNSTSGVPSVRILPDSGKVFSDNGSCPLNDGYAHDAFDCYRLLDHGGDMSVAVAAAAKELGIEQAEPSQARTETESPPFDDGDMPDWFADAPGGLFDDDAENTAPTQGNAKTKTKKTLNTIVNLLSAPPWAGVIGFNEFRQCIEKRTATPYKGKAGAWVDFDTAETMLHLERTTGTAFGRDLVDLGIMAIAHRNAFNPAQDRLRGLADHWDGQDRLSTWLVDYLAARVNDSNREYLAEIGEKWLKGVAARVLIPGCKRDDVLVLRGPQGWRKSTAAQAISDAIHPEAFTDSVDLGNLAEAKIQIRGIIIAELGELAGMAKAEVESIKAFVSARMDHFREKFGRYAQDFQRTVSFIGSTNDQTFLKDPTGNRRWWPVTLEQPIDIARLVAALPQLIGEAAARVLNDEAWHVTAEKALEQADRVREAHFEEDVWTDAVMRIIDAMEARGDVITTAVILDDLNIPRPQQTPNAQKRVGSILRVNGYEEARRWINNRTSKQRFWKKITNARDVGTNGYVGTDRQTQDEPRTHRVPIKENSAGTNQPKNPDVPTTTEFPGTSGYTTLASQEAAVPTYPLVPGDSVLRENFNGENPHSPLATTIITTLQATPGGMTRADLERRLAQAHPKAGPAMVKATINQLLLDGRIAPQNGRLVAMP